MSSQYHDICTELKKHPKRWLVTGAAGFIGSHIVETLLKLEQDVVRLDNFSSGTHDNLAAIRALVGEKHWAHFKMIEGDIRNLDDCRKAAAGVNYISHQAALASVPRSIDDPISSTQVNVDGFVNVAFAARDAGVSRIVYASSSAVYGDDPGLPKVEEKIGEALSPYGLSKYTNELYAGVFAKVYGLEFVGLRYFNVFGPRQSLEGPYAAVLPCWVRALLKGVPCEVNGDGTTSRDFCFVTNAVQANILGACTSNKAALQRAFNVAVGEQTTLNELYVHLIEALGHAKNQEYPAKPQYLPFRQGDIMHSLASINAARELLGYEPGVRIGEGLKHYVQWIVGQNW